MLYWKVNIFDILALVWVGSGLGLFYESGNSLLLLPGGFWFLIVGVLLGLASGVSNLDHKEKVLK